MAIWRASRCDGAGLIGSSWLAKNRTDPKILDSRPAPDAPGRGCAGERAPKIASAARARVPPEPQRCHSGPSIAPLGLPQKGGFDSGVQVRRYAHDWNLVETLAEMAECKISGGIGGLDCGT